MAQSEQGSGAQGTGEQAQGTGGVSGWLSGRLPDDWFEGPPEVQIDRDEIVIVGTLPAPEVRDGEDAREAEIGRISRFRESTREHRMKIAREAERRYDRKVAWGAKAGETRAMFTSLSVPVMTRLRQPERQVLDTLVESGVARSRADALAWCVKLVGRNADEWLTDLREALQAVQRVRGQGPGTAA